MLCSVPLGVLDTVECCFLSNGSILQLTCSWCWLPGPNLAEFGITVVFEC